MPYFFELFYRFIILYQFVRGNTGSRPAILSLIPGYADQFVLRSLLNENPQVLTELADEACFNMDQAELCEHCQFVASTISVSPQQATTVELVTRKQACEKRWFAYVQKRAGDSFSREKRVCHTRLSKPSQSLIKDICFVIQESTHSSAAMQWGCDNENTARQQYFKLTIPLRRFL